MARRAKEFADPNEIRHTHRSARSGWMRAALMGANDGLLSISGLMTGIAAARSTPGAVLLAGLAGLGAGILSMAGGEYVAVCSQADAQRADMELEETALRDEYELEIVELAGIYAERGLDPDLALQVARKLMAHDALGAHARDDIGITPQLAARPIQAALVSGLSFALGGAVPMMVAPLVPVNQFITWNSGITFAVLLVFGAAAARVGGAPMVKGALRVLAVGAMVLLLTYCLGTSATAAP